MTNLALLPGWLDPSTMINGMGSWAVLGIMLVLFAECGLLIGFFLPGDTLLFMAALFVSTKVLHVNLILLILLEIVAAFVGNMVGYGIGYKVGPAVFNRPDARFLKPEHIERSSKFFDKYGKITVVLARFVPVVRTVATVMAGAAKMNAKVYTGYSLLGGALWVALVSVAGFYLGKITFIQQHVDLLVVLAVVAVVLFSAGPAIYHWQGKRKANKSDGATVPE
ncbi:MAG: DedA family protein [Actinomycetota bacterium]|nr:DedA family protein [Actinomycetota bacterium]